MLRTKDIEIRKSFHKKLLKGHHNCPETIVVDELGVDHGRKRIDIAVLNGRLHGYEIKSSLDTLSRLEDQLASYQKCFEKLTIIVAPNHLENVLTLVPDWVGIIQASKGKRGAITFKNVRRSKVNEEIDLFSLSHLLWRPEAISLLEKAGLASKELRGSRKQLYAKITEAYDLRALTEEIKQCFFKRPDWRDHLQPASNGG